MSQIGRPHGVGSQGIVGGTALPSIITNGPFWDCVLPILTTFGPVGLEVLHIKRMFPIGSISRYPLNLLLWLPSGHLRLLMPVDQPTYTRVLILPDTVDRALYEEVSLTQNGGGRNIVGTRVLYQGILWFSHIQF